MAEELQDAFATVTILDRQIGLARPSEGQIVQISRAISAIERSRAGGGQHNGVVVTALARAMDVLLALIIDPDDLYFVDEGLTTGTINLEPEMSDVMKAVADAIPDENEAPKNGPVKRTSARARARR